MMAYGVAVVTAITTAVIIIAVIIVVVIIVAVAVVENFVVVVVVAVTTSINVAWPTLGTGSDSIACGHWPSLETFGDILESLAESPAEKPNREFSEAIRNTGSRLARGNKASH